GGPTATPGVPTATPSRTVPAPTATLPPPRTPTPSFTPGGPTATPCPIQFTDVPPTDPFYTYIRCLACRGYISGYSDGTYRGGNTVTRGQVAKIVANSGGLSDPIPAVRQTFHDVPYGDPFWVFIERLSSIGAINGYTCGGPGEPCDGGNRPYFRTYNNVTRSQLAKIVAITAGYNETPTGQTFTDVAPGHPFYRWVEQVALHGVISGYTCGSPPAGACDPQQRPWFLPYNSATRSQTAKIAANTFLPNCQTPQR
ncbi:MAG TPA: S-layer homology domain-containing protein, partial [Chloroflexia bacterium]|nr:S-layer homology domain-containing protein [Chloroflexia bacterium]